MTLTKQQIFDQVVTQIVTQGGQSKSRDGACMYRGEHNRRCAVGAIMPDELYDINMEGEAVDDLLSHLDNVHSPLYDSEGIHFLAALDVTFLAELQIAHDFRLQGNVDIDFAPDWGNFKVTMEGIANSHSLSPAILSKLPS